MFHSDPLRASMWVLFCSVLLSSCTSAHPNYVDPYVTAASPRAAAQVCASRGFAYVVRTAEGSFYCLLTNADDEPEAVPVESLLRSDRSNNNE